MARGYEQAGAAAISVLTERGLLRRVAWRTCDEVRAGAALPVLRKDFVVDPWQVWEARAAGADAVLLIVGRPHRRRAAPLLDVAGEAGLDALVEVHDRAELDRALAAGSRIVGVNNRDLKTLAVSLETARRRSRRPFPTTSWRWRRAVSARAPTSRACARRASTPSWSASASCPRPDHPGEALQRLLEEAS